MTMTRESRDPLSVLCDFAGTVSGQVCCGMPVGGGMDENGNGEPPSCCGQPLHADDFREAIAQVEALYKASGRIKLRYENGLAVVGGLADLMAAREPFTPDSEECGNG